MTTQIYVGSVTGVWAYQFQDENGNPSKGLGLVVETQMAAINQETANRWMRGQIQECQALATTCLRARSLIGTTQRC